MDATFWRTQLSVCEGLSENTIKTYGYSLAWLAKRMDQFEANDTGRLEITVPTPEQVIDYMDSNKVGHSRRMLSYTAMKVWHNCRGEKADSSKYGVPLVQCKRCMDKDYEKQERTPKQVKNWVDFSSLKKHAAKLRASTFALDKNRLWTKQEFADAQLAFILTVHLQYPIRRDLCTVFWGERGDEINYIDEKTHEVVYNKHKTVKWHGTIKHKMSRAMWRIFSLLRKQQKMRDIGSGPILLNRYWRKLSPNGYSSWLRREMKKCEGCEEKAIGCLIIRHSVITHKYKGSMTLAQQKSFATACMHGSKQNALYRVEKN